MGEGGKQNASQKHQPGFWWTVINAWQLKKKKKKKTHSHSGLHVQAHILALQTPLDFLLGLLVLALTIQAEVENWTMFLCLEQL